MNKNYSHYPNYPNYSNYSENFIDFKSDLKSDSQEIMNMLQEKSPLNTNLGDFVQDEKSYLNKLNDNLLNTEIDMKYDKLLDKFSKGFKKNNVVIKKKGLDLFNLSWRVYRTISLILILISFFVLKIIHDKFVERGADKYIVKIYKVVSVLIIINLCIFLFYRTYFRYISTLKGKRGKRGKYGVKGIPGGNSVCDISKKKIATLYREKNRKPIKDIINTNPDIVVDLENTTDNNFKGWWNLTLQDQNDKAKNKTEILKPMHTNIGMPCCNTFDEDTNKCSPAAGDTVPKSPTCFENPNKNDNNLSNEKFSEELKKAGTTLTETEKNKLLGGNKPIIGASINFNKTTKAIQGIIFYSDKNKKHNPNKHKIGVFDDDKTNNSKGIGPGGNLGKNSIKQTFQCPANSAIYKIEGMYDTDSLKGLKFYCQDIKTGKSKKAYNSDNKKVYGVNFGIDSTPTNESYSYDKVECPIYSEHINKNPTSTGTGAQSSVIYDYNHYPSFLSNVGGTYDTSTNSINNLKFNNCSYYRS